MRVPTSAYAEPKKGGGYNCGRIASLGHRTKKEAKDEILPCEGVTRIP